MHTILETFISVAHNAPPSTHTHHQWWNWFLSQSHTHACTQTHQRYHRLFIKVHFPNRFLPINLSIFPLKKVFFSLFLARLFGFHIHGSYICMMEYWYLEQHRDALFLPTSCSKTGCSAYSETAVQPELWMPHCAYCEWQARRHWVLYSWDAMQLCGY